ncbi:hypothetical protein [Synechococcus phage BUCT-ZZ01]|nr:hypothetical protein [Synechococcus phage BUCT-ZZ01]
MFTIKQNYFEVRELDCEGKHVVNVHSRWTERALAEAARGSNPYLSISEVKLDLVILETLDELYTFNLEQKKRAALAKLTEEDRKVLGL